MKINIVAVGKIKEQYLLDAISEYTKRISKYATINHIVLKDEPIRNNIDDESIKRIEGNRILEGLPSGYNIVLDLKGQQVSSEGLASRIDNILSYDYSVINFVIGGSLGLSSEVVAKADFLLCLSKMTFPHQVAKVLLLEQIYRVFKILNNETYHK